MNGYSNPTMECYPSLSENSPYQITYLILVRGPVRRNRRLQSRPTTSKLSYSFDGISKNRLETEETSEAG